MHHAIAVGKELCLGFVWGMFIVFFQISTVIIYEYPDIPAFKFFAALHPYDLSVMITWLHPSRDQFQNEPQAAIDHLEKIKGLL